MCAFPDYTCSGEQSSVLGGLLSTNIQISKMTHKRKLLPSLHCDTSPQIWETDGSWEHHRHLPRLLFLQPVKSHKPDTQPKIFLSL